MDYIGRAGAGGDGDGDIAAACEGGKLAREDVVKAGVVGDGGDRG